MYLYEMVFNYVKSKDFYGVTLSPMNFKGKETMKCFYGGFFSLMVKTLMITFIIGKFNEMLRFTAPSITQLLL